MTAQQLEIRAAIYTRVSTSMQADEGHSLATQEALCQEYCDRKWGTDNYTMEVFREPGQSGAATVRQVPQLEGKPRQVLSDLIDRVKADEFTHIIIYDVDRMAREDFLWKSIRLLFLEPNRVSLRVVSSDLNMEDENDAFQGDLQALLAAWERNNIRHRILDAQEQRRQAGYPSTGHTPWGWKWEDKDKVESGKYRGFVRNPERAPYVQEMVDMLLDEGKSLRMIAEHMHETGILSGRKRRAWTSQRVRDIITHPVHAGYIRLKKEGCPLKDRPLKRGQHYSHRLFDPETRQRILQTLGERAVLPSRTVTDENSPLLGTVRCGHCGWRLYVHRGPDGTRYYQCRSSELGEPRDCPGVMKKAEVVEAHVFEAIADFASSPAMSRLVGEEAEKMLASH